MRTNTIIIKKYMALQYVVAILDSGVLLRRKHGIK